MSPSQVSGEGVVPATGVIALPHASCITGGVGAVASAAQFTVVDPSAGRIKSGISIVTIDIPDFILPADGSTTVNCAADATAPTPPVMQDACGNAITPVAGTTPSPLTCEGDMVYTFTYTDCASNTHVWT